MDFKLFWVPFQATFPYLSFPPKLAFHAKPEGQWKELMPSYEGKKVQDKTANIRFIW